MLRVTTGRLLHCPPPWLVAPSELGRSHMSTYKQFQVHDITQLAVWTHMDTQMLTCLHTALHLAGCIENCLSSTMQAIWVLACM